jgi:hypothetical protein
LVSLNGSREYLGGAHETPNLKEMANLGGLCNEHVGNG